MRKNDKKWEKMIKNYEEIHCHSGVPWDVTIMMAYIMK